MSDKRITGLDAATSLAVTDLVPVVVDPGSTPVTKKITFRNLIKATGGTAFPASPGNGDRFFRSDLGMACYHDGTRWLTENEYSVQGPIDKTFSADATQYIAPVRTDYAAYITRIIAQTNVAATNDGTKYWTIIVRGLNDAGVSATNVDSFTTAADTQAVNTQHVHAPSITATPANRSGFDVSVAKTSTPGNLILNIRVQYRMIIT